MLVYVQIILIKAIQITDPQPHDGAYSLLSMSGSLSAHLTPFARKLLTNHMKDFCYNYAKYTQACRNSKQTKKASCNHLLLWGFDEKFLRPDSALWETFTTDSSREVCIGIRCNPWESKNILGALEWPVFCLLGKPSPHTILGHFQLQALKEVGDRDDAENIIWTRSSFFKGKVRFPPALSHSSKSETTRIQKWCCP